MFLTAQEIRHVYCFFEKGPMPGYKAMIYTPHSFRSNVCTNCVLGARYEVEEPSSSRNVRPKRETGTQCCSLGGLCLLMNSGDLHVLSSVWFGRRNRVGILSEIGIPCFARTQVSFQPEQHELAGSNCFLCASRPVCSFRGLAF